MFPAILFSKVLLNSHIRNNFLQCEVPPEAKRIRSSNYQFESVLAPGYEYPQKKETIEKCELSFYRLGTKSVFFLNEVDHFHRRWNSFSLHRDEKWSLEVCHTKLFNKGKNNYISTNISFSWIISKAITLTMISSFAIGCKNLQELYNETNIFPSCPAYLLCC